MTKRVRGGASRARSAGQVSFERLTQSVEAAQAALKDVRKELSKGTRDVLGDLDTTLKDARKHLRSVSRTVTKDLEEIQRALTTSKPTRGRTAGARKTAAATTARKTTAAKTTTAKKRTTTAKATTARRRTTAVKATTARTAKPTAAPSDQVPPPASAGKETGSE